MSKNLVIVESPAKAKTIEKYLGKDFTVLASFGHVRDLIPKEGAVEPDNDFKMNYEIVEKSAQHMKKIELALKSADHLYLATDPDREGEAISWHLCEILRERKKLKDKTVSRVVFHEITKKAIQEAMTHPRDLAMDLVNAQQARRALDYLVGFTLSPLLWRKIRPGLSAGRVQSPALKMIVEREEEIEKFQSREYWSIEANLNAQKQKFSAKLAEYQGQKVEQFTIVQDKQALDVKENLLKQANCKLLVSKVEKKQRKRHPAPPFITSTLQQEAARKLGFTAQRTMRAAQQLYEAGVITYMRTDSTNLSNEAVADIREFIAKEYGKQNVPDEVNIYKTKSKNAQEAHEAIRPTAVFNTPASMGLEDDQRKLYTLIWQRTVACQMMYALMDVVSVDLMCGKDNRFRASGSTVVSPGFMLVYQEDQDDEKKSEGDEKILPLMKEGDLIDLLEILCEQHFTEPPPRYTEASLIKALEEYGIGRPSTYASIITTLTSREYVLLEQKRFHPTDVGRIVSKFLTNYFLQYVDYGFTAGLEDTLDAVSRGEEAWIPVLKNFWSPFKKLVDNTMENVKRSDVTQEKIEEKCPLCQKQLSIRLGRNGRFIGCSGYPECSYTRNLDNAEPAPPPEKVEGRQCPQCSADLVIKQSRFGKFIGCSAYPKCKFIENLEKPKDTGVPCPTCQKGMMIQRKSKTGKTFFSCAKYPDCKYAVWNEPIAKECSKCQWPMMTKKVTKQKGEQIVCPQEKCQHIE
jgi:DNA topoisomerase-1